MMRLPVVSNKARIMAALQAGGCILTLKWNGNAYVQSVNGCRIAQLRWDVRFHSWGVVRRALTEPTGRVYGYEYRLEKGEVQK